MPGAAAKSLRMTAASPSRSSPLSHDSNTQIGFQRDAWQVLFQGRASGINTVEARCQGVGRFALRIPDESTGTRASGPEHCRRVQIAVSKLPGSPGNRTSAFGVWSSNQGMDQLGEGTSRRSLRSGHGPWERWDLIPGPAGCGNVGCWSPDPASWHRSVGLRYGQRGFRYRMTGSSGTAFTPTPIGLALLLWSHA